jgi:hypothetical protein
MTYIICQDCLHTAFTQPYIRYFFFLKVIFFLSCRSSLTTQTLGAKSWVSRLRATRRSFFFFSTRCIRQHTLHTSARLYEGAKSFFLRLCGGSVKALSMLVRRVGIRQHTQHTSAYAAYVSIRQHTMHTPSHVSIRQHMSAYAAHTRQHTSAYVSIRQHRQHTSAYVRMERSAQESYIVSRSGGRDSA